MRIVNARRISQLFFFTLLVWFCLAATLGERWWQLRGWPVNWLLQLDPLLGLGLLLATGTVYAGLLWGLLTLGATLFLGRVFCGWICPFGALQQFVGWLGARGGSTAARVRRNQPHPAQRIKYWLLLFILAAAAPGLLKIVFSSPFAAPRLFVGLALGTALVLAGLAVLGPFSSTEPERGGGNTADGNSRRFGFAGLRFAGFGFGFGFRPGRGLMIAAVAAIAAAGIALHWLLPDSRWLAASLQSGLLDPLALVYRSVNLVLLPLAGKPVEMLTVVPRFYEGTAAIGILFLAVLLLSLHTPRFYCRFLCPTGALLGLLGRRPVWRIARVAQGCDGCRRCEAACEGACAPTGNLRQHECVVCLNCRESCRHGLIAFRGSGAGIDGPAVAQAQAGPDLARREIVTALAAGLVIAPVLRLGGAGTAAAAASTPILRPPGALAEADFLARCIKCGQCMRICPTRVLHPAVWQAGLEGIWSPVLNFRLGTSGCQHNCVACGQICPTAAIRPISVDERMGRGAFAPQGPLRIGLAFVDRGRCLPWAMDRPCIVCQENCPVSPKAIFTREVFQPLRDGLHVLAAAEAGSLGLARAALEPDQWAGGDYWCRVGRQGRLQLLRGNTRDQLILAGRDPGLTDGAPFAIMGGNSGGSGIAGGAAEKEGDAGNGGAGGIGRVGGGDAKAVFAPAQPGDPPPRPGDPVQVFIRLQQPQVDPRRCIGCGVCEHECPVHGLRAIRVSAENASREPEHKLTIS